MTIFNKNIKQLIIKAQAFLSLERVRKGWSSFWPNHIFHRDGNKMSKNIRSETSLPKCHEVSWGWAGLWGPSLSLVSSAAQTVPANTSSLTGHGCSACVAPASEPHSDRTAHTRWWHWIFHHLPCSRLFYLHQFKTQKNTLLFHFQCKVSIPFVN